ncbi:helix-turn-helix domain-containing protein [Micromonospora sp. DT43]|uniref:helix-turn-helix domain-containing protein n=1 Tax=Micromonospora sp. DT43 TaxID=3393440 RepID=UPI003CF9A941
MTGDHLPIGRRVAYLRARRKLSQQSFADRLGKSKSWVDKVERGVRSLERVSTIRDIAAVLRVDTAALLGRDARPVGAGERIEGVMRIRAAMSTYVMALGPQAASRDVLPADRLARQVKHAWTTFQHARYPEVVELLPRLLIDVQRAHVRDPEVGRAALVEAYRVTASVLVKLNEATLAWLAADRAMSAAMGDRVLVAAAAVQLGQVLRTSARARTVMLAAAYQLAPRDGDEGTPSELSLCGSLLVQAALIAARSGDDRTTADLLHDAAGRAARVGDGHDHHRTGFGPTAVELARAAAAVDLGNGADAVGLHRAATAREGWRWLPLEHRAAHLLDAARAYLQSGDSINAARVLVQADRIAPAEVRHRPAARDLVALVVRDSDAPATIVQLAIRLGVV